MLTMVIVSYVLRSIPIEKVNECITYVGRTKPLKNQDNGHGSVLMAMQLLVEEYIK